MTVFNDATRDLLDGTNFATVATLDERSGAPQTSVVWVVRDGDDVLFSTLAGRQKARNLERDPRLSLTVIDQANPYRTVEIRGTAVVTEEDALAVQDAVSQKYLGQASPPDQTGDVRVTVRITPTRVIGFSV
jgi:PPOX class probable F420-dependent enzyme